MRERCRPQRRWTARPQQKSLVFSLEGGKRYYIQTLAFVFDAKSLGFHYLSVAWTRTPDELPDVSVGSATSCHVSVCHASHVTSPRATLPRVTPSCVTPLVSRLFVSRSLNLGWDTGPRDHGSAAVLFNHVRCSSIGANLGNLIKTAVGDQWRDQTAVT
jgi:hypothetical protein